MMACYLDMDKLLEQKIWVDEDGNYLPIYDIPNKKIFQIEKKLMVAVNSGASEYIKKWLEIFSEEAKIRMESEK